MTAARFIVPALRIIFYVLGFLSVGIALRLAWLYRTMLQQGAPALRYKARHVWVLALAWSTAAISLSVELILRVRQPPGWRTVVNPIALLLGSYGLLLITHYVEQLEKMGLRGPSGHDEHSASSGTTMPEPRSNQSWPN